jgi:LL-diaminopimelate aminotransferase
MVKRNPYITRLQNGYLFPEIHKRKTIFLQQNPTAKLINLSVGNTTQPLPSVIVNELIYRAKKLSSIEGYSGYGPEQGILELREKIATTIYSKNISSDEIFISDGMKCDLGRLQLLFGPTTTMALQNPTYPVYVDTSVISGKTGYFNHSIRQYQGIVYMPCIAENDFFPNLSLTPPTDLIYFCSPNNPTGAAATHKQLKQLIDFATANHSIILYDAAYAAFLQNSYPRSIYEIEGAHKVAIEMGSFSKMAGFTGLRLGWSVIPNELKFEDGSPVSHDWSRIHHTFFNGASNIVQFAGISVLESQGWREIKKTIDYYRTNAQELKKTFQKLGYPTYGGDQVPYIWVNFFPQNSWEAFEDLMQKTHIVAAPGIGFGAGGEGYLRFSAFSAKHEVENAIRSLESL